MDKEIELLWIEAAQNYYNSNYTVSKNLFEEIYNNNPKIKNKHFLLNLVAVYSHLAMEPELKVISKRLLHYYGHDRAVVKYISSLYGSLSEFTDSKLLTHFIVYILIFLFLALYTITIYFLLIKKQFPFFYYTLLVILILIVYSYWNFPSFFIKEGISIEEIKVYDFPLDEAQKYFTVPSAASIYILNETSLFYRIRTKNGKEGWVKKNKIIKVYND